MRMLVNVSNHTVAELELRVRHGYRLIEAARQRASDASERNDINAMRMHLGYAMYIQRCIDQSQDELDKRRA